MITTQKCKIILLGEAYVGKTCLIERYITNEFNGVTDTTIGTSYSTKNVTLENGMKYTLDIWDTAGTESYRSINKIFYRDALIAILVYDITNRNSFNEIKEYWLEEIRKERGKNISKIN